MEDYWLAGYLWRKQKLSLLLALLLVTLPFWQAKLTGTSSVAFIFVMAHSTIMFYGVCYFVIKMAALEFGKEYERRRVAAPLAVRNVGEQIAGPEGKRVSRLD